MKVTFKLYAMLQDYLPHEARMNNALTLELEDGVVIADLIRRFSLPEKLCHLVLLDGVFIAPDERASRVLRDGETLAIWPPIAGG